MEIKSRFDHYNINVVDLQKSLDFYEKALGLKEVRRKDEIGRASCRERV